MSGEYRRLLQPVHGHPENQPRVSGEYSSTLLLYRDSSFINLQIYIETDKRNTKYVITFPFYYITAWIFNLNQSTIV